MKEHPFNPESFRTEGHKVVDILADYLHRTSEDNQMAVLPWTEPDELTEIFAFDNGEGALEPFEKYLKRIIDKSIHLHHPRYIGHQVTSPLPLAALVQFCTSLLNNGAAIFEMGPVNMAMERNVIRKFKSLIGYSQGSDGIFTHGGSAGNLTAMLAARQNKTVYNIWEEGVKPVEKPAFLVSESSHYSIGRHIRIMGLGEESAVKVPVDGNFRLRTDLLEKSIKNAEDKGLKVISLIASSCSTATGTYDNINEAADFCEKYGLWLHVDGAHGMGILFSDRYRNLVNGIERVDSIDIDFHKMFLVPALNTLVMFKNGERSFETFAQKATYLFNNSQVNPWFNSAVRTIECTKSALGIIAYTALKYYGDNYFKEYIEASYDLATTFAGMIGSYTDLELAVKPEANIVCFRYAPEGYNDDILNKINASIRDIIIKEGSFYIVQVELEGKLFIRNTLINPLTTASDLSALLQRVNIIGNEQLEQIL